MNRKVLYVSIHGIYRWQLRKLKEDATWDQFIKQSDMSPHLDLSEDVLKERMKIANDWTLENTDFISEDPKEFMVE